jgi:hypothetical protein
LTETPMCVLLTLGIQRSSSITALLSSLSVLRVVVLMNKPVDSVSLTAEHNVTCGLAKCPMIRATLYNLDGRESPPSSASVASLTVVMFCTD